MIRVGVLGTGNISGWWTKSVLASDFVRVAAIGSRSDQRAREFAAKYGLQRWHGSYASLVRDTEIDAVYVALPSQLHAKWTIAAIRAGKHVLCEKPLARNERDAIRMFDAARRADVRLIEGFPYRFTAQTRRIVDLIAQGAIGEVRVVRSNMTYVRAQSVRRGTDGEPLDPLIGGGALLDSGCYCVSIARLLAGRRPTRVSATAVFECGGVDESLVGTLEFDGGLLAQISCSYVLPDGPQTQIIGTDGIIEADFANMTDAGESAFIRLKRGASWTAGFETIEVEGADGFRREIEALAVQASGCPHAYVGMSEEESIDVAATLDALRKSARSGRPLAVARMPQSAA